jgi:hypothetical protein
MSKKKELVSNYPKRAITRATNKFRLNSKDFVSAFYQ